MEEYSELRRAKEQVEADLTRARAHYREWIPYWQRRAERYRYAIDDFLEGVGTRETLRNAGGEAR